MKRDILYLCQFLNATMYIDVVVLNYNEFLSLFLLTIGLPPTPPKFGLYGGI